MHPTAIWTSPTRTDCTAWNRTRDSSFAAVYAGLASAHVVRPFFTETQSSVAWPAARAAANMALARDSSLAEAWAVLGFGRVSYDFDWAGADVAFRKAITLNPNDAMALARAVDERDPLFVLNQHDPIYDGLRSDPQFVALLAGIGLDP